MTDPTPLNSNRNDNVENQEQFLIENPIGIVQKLRLLAKNNTMVTATFNGGSQTLNTAVLEVIRDRDLIALDYGPNESINKLMLAADRIIFKAELDGIDVQFAARSISKAKFQGEPVFAIPIPESILWIQRRQSYRVRVPMGVPAHLELTLEPGTVENFLVLDISSGGVAIEDKKFLLSVEPGDQLQHCKLVLPGHGDANVILEVRNRFQINRANRDAGQRVGFSFVNLNMGFGAEIQRYINELELLRKRTSD